MRGRNDITTFHCGILYRFLLYLPLKFRGTPENVSQKWAIGYDMCDYNVKTFIKIPQIPEQTAFRR